jgi:AmmeMemoRadiSam system protein B
MSTTDRAPAAAGMFYPGDPGRLERVVAEHLERAHERAARGGEVPKQPKLIVVPHAGYVYSGDVAARAFVSVTTRPERVILIGPAHRVGFRGISAGRYAHYRSPTGRLPVDLDAVDGLIGAGLARFVAAADAPEHCLEVMLPFLTARFGEVPIVPLLVGCQGGEEVDAALERILRPDDLVLCSTDLSHYLSCDEARARDLATLAAVEEGRFEAIGPEDACGYRGLGAVMRLGAQRGYQPRMLEYQSSGDTAGDRDRVVGYGAVAFT